MLSTNKEVQFFEIPFKVKSPNESITLEDLGVNGCLGPVTTVVAMITTSQKEAGVHLNTTSSILHHTYHKMLKQQLVE